MSKIEVNTVEPQCGTTLTLGASGDTVTLGSGASQSGFGRTGTVDWQTTKKTASFTAVNGEGYFVDTNGGAITATLPASPSAGNIVYIKDYQGTFNSNACTVARNGSNIRGGTDNFVLNKANAGAVFIYVDATEGWQVFLDGSNADAQSTFITATGGTITTSGNYKIHTFTGPGTFCVSQVSDVDANNEVSYMVVAGGGGGGTRAAAGAGAGGFRESKSGVDCYTASPLEGSTNITVTATAFPITVGAGGTANGPSNNEVPGNQGNNSVFSTVTSAGGGGGKGGCSPYAPVAPRANGGSGGGGGPQSNPNLTPGGTGNTPPVSPAQGTNGGSSGINYNGGGGGGATVAGSNATPSGGGAGGAGATTSISGSPTAYAGGGGGGSWTSPNPGPGGAGGTGGGADGVDANTQNSYPSYAADAGTANTGGGGGGAGGGDTSSANPTGPALLGGAGGSGIVIIRYKFQ